MSKHTDGDDPAFPVTTASGFTFRGMDLRDWFAGQVLCGLAMAKKPTVEDQRLYSTFEHMSQVAYGLADAMLAARGKPTIPE